jgi:hypothetical protein
MPPGLLVKVAGRLLVDLAVFNKMVQEDREREQAKFARVRGWL